MDYPPPVDILEVPLIAGTHETDRRYVALTPVIEHELASALAIEILPTHQSPAPHCLGAGRDRFHMLANKPGGKDRGSDAPGNSVSSDPPMSAGFVMKVWPPDRDVLAL